MTESFLNNTGAEGDGNISPEDLVFTKEIHTGERVIEEVVWLRDKSKETLEAMVKSSDRKSEQSREAWQNMLQYLSPEEKVAFKCALSRGLENFYYTHYNAIRRRMDSNPQ